MTNEERNRAQDILDNLLRDAYSRGVVDSKSESESTIDGVYRKRNILVALLSKVYPSGKKKTAIEGWDESWHGCVYIDFPWGQGSWHYHEDDGWMFDHLSEYSGEWDGHTTDEKYNKIISAITSKGEQ